MLYASFDFDITSKQISVEKPKVYVNERTRYKTNKKLKIKTTKLVWPRLSSVVPACFFLVVALEH